MQHTRLVIGAAIERAAKATAAKNVDFMLMDLSDEAARLLVFYMFSMSSPQVLMDRGRKQEETVERIGNAFSQEKKKTSTLPIPLMQKPPPACNEVTNADFLPLSGGTFVSYRSVVLALAMHTNTIAVTSEGIAMGRQKYGSIASVPFRHKSVSQQPMRA